VNFFRPGNRRALQPFRTLAFGVVLPVMTVLSIWLGIYTTTKLNIIETIITNVI
jgi:hypothetical protein